MKGSIFLASLLIFGLVGTVSAQGPSKMDWRDNQLALHVPRDILQKFRNPDGSCVQCSNSMTGTDQNIAAFAYLLWDTDYGKKVRGGSNPSRVAGYARERNVRIYNVTGSTTWEWMRWAAKNGRGCAIGAGTNHFQTLIGYLPLTKTWCVVNNNGDQHIQEYSDDAFRSLHLASGPWCVILDYPPAPAPPEVVEWWAKHPTKHNHSRKPCVQCNKVKSEGSFYKFSNGETSLACKACFKKMFFVPSVDLE